MTTPEEHLRGGKTEWQVTPSYHNHRESVSFIEYSLSAPDYLVGQKEIMSRGYKATVLIRTDVAERIVEAQREVDKKWDIALTRKRDPMTLSRTIAQTAFATRPIDQIVEI